MSNLFLLFQVLNFIILFMEWDSVATKIQEDRKAKVWIGRVFIFFLPLLLAISISYNPLLN